MPLKITDCNITPVLEIGEEISLQTNGMFLRIFRWKDQTMAAQITRPEITFHTDGAKTILEISGFLSIAERWQLIKFTAE